MTTTVRVTPETHAKLQRLAHEQQESIQSVLEQAVEAYRRQRMFEANDAAYAALREDPVAWAEEMAERAIWDVTLADGLEDW